MHTCTSIENWIVGRKSEQSGVPSLAKKRLEALAVFARKAFGYLGEYLPAAGHFPGGNPD